MSATMRCIYLALTPARNSHSSSAEGIDGTAKSASPARCAVSILRTRSVAPRVILTRIYLGVSDSNDVSTCLICCAHCKSKFHMECLDVPVDKKVKTAWRCAECLGMPKTPEGASTARKKVDKGRERNKEKAQRYVVASIKKNSAICVEIL